MRANRAFGPQLCLKPFASFGLVLEDGFVEIAAHRVLRFVERTLPIRECFVKVIIPVRIEASRLRRSLERYYLTAGEADLVVVELPKGGYVPRFELNTQTAPETAPPALPDASDGSPSPTQLVLTRGPCIVLSPFENLSGDPVYDVLSRGIAEELIT